MSAAPAPLAVHETAIDGLLVVDLPVHGDARGWFTEHWQRAKMTALGLPDLGPVQQNVSFNAAVGTTRGFHAEPWDKYLGVATGRAFGAWVDLRPGPGFGRVVTHDLRPGVAVFVPRGVANAFQTLEPDTAYTYLVNDHWSPDAAYSAVALGDPDLGVPWPVPLERAVLSDKDRANPPIADAAPVPPLVTIVVGANGQLGRALRASFEADAAADGSAGAIRFLGRDDLDLGSADAVRSHDWSGVGTIVNAAAYTAVDAAEGAGRADAWAVNATAVAALAEVAARRRMTLVHVSTDYVFDGLRHPHREDEPVAPLGVYGASKAAGELAVRQVPRHYLVRTSWVVGDGPNFVRTMRRLAEQGVDPAVVNDQTGRVTFADELARGIRHLLDHHAPYGVYHLSNGGPVVSWYDLARQVFTATGHDPDRVRATTAADYAAELADAGRVVAPRPAHSEFDLAKLRATGFEPEPAADALRRYLETPR
ncbi:bifunctional dTDP-4-dehydrorhamnose 3,5-epimerase family protein/NAD(P)-dependent oxidoreductase [Agromyces sp. C10]|uniref:sugar nucleotide-binding protein n=1 Tax=Agromyces sp. C10 TaxID=2935077 RepID=UPI00200B500F|nr:bifunctional dTDP-4-dehydrorhamnose 3,5-epimerase family protein/NAD(P)-dependent oxidoreductase [Agromyces sp. C10]MCK8608300.1 bifunctional dTDP-4-dehydrorhamnose 3,5-epimerase family protein/NAD(P)-dependent oxidoreductase [Agromyces sp. C10]